MIPLTSMRQLGDSLDTGRFGAAKSSLVSPNLPDAAGPRRLASADTASQGHRAKDRSLVSSVDALRLEARLAPWRSYCTIRSRPSPPTCGNYSTAPRPREGTPAMLLADDVSTGPHDTGAVSPRAASPLYYSTVSAPSQTLSADRQSGPGSPDLVVFSGSATLRVQSPQGRAGAPTRPNDNSHRQGGDRQRDGR